MPQAMENYRGQAVLGDEVFENFRNVAFLDRGAYLLRDHQAIIPITFFQVCLLLFLLLLDFQQMSRYRLRKVDSADAAFCFRLFQHQGGLALAVYLLREGKEHLAVFPPLQAL